jgi:hypothetical protein
MEKRGFSHGILHYIKMNARRGSLTRIIKRDDRLDP